jgi:ABC-type phosphate/phosphonate transport system ATPase subunit
MLEIFGVTKEPFVHPLATKEVFQWRDLREGMKRLEYGVKCGGVICVIGKSGSGKTTLLRSFTSQLEPGLFKVLTDLHRGFSFKL